MTIKTLQTENRRLQQELEAFVQECMELKGQLVDAEQRAENWKLRYGIMLFGLAVMVVRLPKAGAR